jgi:hypothetical protein
MQLDYSTPPRGPRHQWLWAALIVLGCVAAVSIGLVIFDRIVIASAFAGEKVNLLDFEPVKWQSARKRDSSYQSVRLRMADSFLADQKPVGKSRDQIVALLGEPDDTPYFSNYDMVYYLGPERGFMGIDSEWLVLRLSNNTIIEARLTID